MILLVLGLLMLTGCTEQLGSGPASSEAPKTPRTYSEVYQTLRSFQDSDAVAKEEKRKADENALPDDSTAFNLIPLSESALSKARKKCKKLLGEYNAAAKQYNTLPSPRKGAPEGDPDLVIVGLHKTLNARTAGLPFTCGEAPPKPDLR